MSRGRKETSDTEHRRSSVAKAVPFWCAQVGFHLNSLLFLFGPCSISGGDLYPSPVSLSCFFVSLPSLYPFSVSSFLPPSLPSPHILFFFTPSLLRYWPCRLPPWCGLPGPKIVPGCLAMGWHAMWHVTGPRDSPTPLYDCWHVCSLLGLP